MKVKDSYNALGEEKGRVILSHLSLSLFFFFFFFFLFSTLCFSNMQVTDAV